MSLDLDSRQRAMLAEMGVPVWWPARPTPDGALVPAVMAELPAEPSRQRAAGHRADRPSSSSGPTAPAVATAPRPAAPEALAPAATGRAEPPARPPVPRRPPFAAGAVPTLVSALPAGIEGMDWPALQTTVQTCQACVMCLGRRTPVLAAPAQALRADWLVLGEPPDDAQERLGAPFVDDAGQLLDNMLKAVGVQRYRPASEAPDPQDDTAGRTPALPDPARTAYLSLVLKCRPALPTAPDAQALSACAHYLRREIALLQPKVILAMGRLAMQVLLSVDHPQGLKLPLGKLRGQVWHYLGVPVVVTYPPAYLLRTGQDKARAWEDLCLAADVAQGQV